MSTLTDHRRTSKGNYRYSIEELFFVTLVGTVCNCNDWEEIAFFAKERQDWFKAFYPYKKSTPSHDTLERFFAKLHGSSLAECMMRWASKKMSLPDQEVISIDGKRMRGSYDKSSNQAALHTVSAFASTNRLTLGQVITDDKSNEITAIPELLNLIDVSSALVSIDAMGCQREIAQGIRKKKGIICWLSKTIKRLFMRILKNLSSVNKWMKYISNTIQGMVVQKSVNVKLSQDWIGWKPNRIGQILKVSFK